MLAGPQRTSWGAGRQQQVRDAFIGWSGEARVANLSRVLELACAQVAEDWETKYNVRPVLAYTYVEPEHTGLSYRAAGWRCGEGGTSGCSPSGGTVMRSVWLKPLVCG